MALAVALNLGKPGAGVVADEIVRLVGPSADLIQISEALRDAAAIVLNQGQQKAMASAPAAASTSDRRLRLPPPPPLPGAGLRIAGCELPAELLSGILEALCNLRCTRSKLALACTSKAWRTTLWHPSFWTSVTFPCAQWGPRSQVKTSTQLTAFVNAVPQRWSATESITLHHGASHKIGKTFLTRFHELAPRLTELKIVATNAQKGDDVLQALAQSPLAKQLTTLRLGGLRFSDVHFHYLHPNPNIPHTPHWHGVPHMSMGKTRQHYAQFSALQHLELFNLPCEATALTHIQLAFGAGSPPPEMTKDPEIVAAKIIAGCPELRTLHLIIPDSSPPLVCGFDVQAARQGLPCIADIEAYNAHRAGLPPVPPPSRKRCYGPTYW